MRRTATVLARVSAVLASWTATMPVRADPPTDSSSPAVAAADVDASVSAPVVFDGFGLDAEDHWDAIAAQAVHGIADAPPSPAFGLPLDIRVRGPTGRSPSSDRLAAELRSSLEGIDLTAGLHADPTVADDGPARWVGGVGMSSAHDRGREAIEFKTSLGRGRQAGVIGVEVGPRIERRLPHGRVFFLDGKAEAQARRPADGGGWMLPRLAEQVPSDAGTVGVAASTGLVR
ncbi:MAG: hypothetical protein ACKOTB_12455 [Planctomycetia bacterium]